MELGAAAALGLALACGVSRVPAEAARGPHDGLHEQIAAVTLKIERQPRDPALYLQRANLYRLHRDWDAAVSDLERARERGAGGDQLDLLRGRLYLDLGWLQSARLFVERYVAAHPRDPAGVELLALALAQAGQHGAAADRYGELIALSPQPLPEYYIARAQARAAVGPEHVDRALAGLDEGVRRLGPIVTLQQLAIELELSRGGFDAALERLATVAAQSGRQERWLLQRGEILLQAGRRAEAREALEACLEAIAGLRARHRNTQAVLDLKARAEDLLRELDESRAGRPAPERP